MATPIRMPDMGTTVEEFRLMAWLVREGDHVELGDALAEIETDKAVTQLESTAKGVVLRLEVEDGDTMYKGDVLAWVGAEGEEAPADDKRCRPRPLPRSKPPRLRSPASPRRSVSSCATWPRAWA